MSSDINAIIVIIIGSVTVVDEGNVVDEDGVVETEVVTPKTVERILSLVTPEVLTKSQGKKKETRLLSDCAFGSHNSISESTKKYGK